MIQTIWYSLETSGTHQSLQHCKGKGRVDSAICESDFSCCDKMPKTNILKIGDAYFGSWVQKFQSMVAWLISFPWTLL